MSAAIHSDVEIERLQALKDRLGGILCVTQSPLEIAILQVSIENIINRHKKMRGIIARNVATRISKGTRIIKDKSSSVFVTEEDVKDSLAIFHEEVIAGRIAYNQNDFK